MAQAEHASRGHAELSPSSSERWMECPGSVLLSRGLPNTSSVYADEGTAAHQLGEMSISNSINPKSLVGTSVSVRGKEWPVTSEMAEFVTVYTNHIWELENRTEGEVWLEHRFSLAALDPPSPMHGTADFVLFDKKNRKLYVRDLKYGMGVLVDVEGNSQLMYYALGALVSLGLQNDVDTISLGIIQPRADHPDGPIRVTELSIVDLQIFGMDLLAAAERALKENAELKAGKHCKFCKAKALCPELRDQAIAVAGREFDLEAPAETLALPEPKLIPVENLAEYISKFKLLEDWIAGVRAHAHAELEAGRPVPGLKLIAKRANRQWAVSEEEIIALAKKNKIKKEALYDQPSLLSPAKLEKVFAFPDSFVKKVSSGTTLAPVEDSRSAVVPQTSGAEFELESAED